MEKLRIKLNTDQANILYYFLSDRAFLIGYKKIIIDLNSLNDLNHYYLLEEIILRLNIIRLKGGRLSINPAEAVTLFKVFNASNNKDQDIYVSNILQAIFNAVHKYLANLL